MTGSQSLSNYPALSPTQMQTVQPTATKHEMAYPAIQSTISSDPWNQNTSSNIMNNRDYYSSLHVRDAHKKFAGPNLNAEQAAWFSDDSQESDDVALGERSGSARRGPFRNIQDREQTAHTRKLTACVRCRMQRIRVCPFSHT